MSRRRPSMLALPALAPLSLLALACGAPSASVDAPPPAASSPPVAVVAPAPTGVPEAPTAAPAASTAPAAAPPPSPFVAVAQLPYAMRLFALEDAMIGVATGPTGGDDAPFGMPAGLFDGERFLPKPAMIFPSVWGYVVDVRGSSAGGVDLVAVGTTGRVGIAEHWVLGSEGRWISKRSRVASLPAGIAELDGARVTLEYPAMFPGAHRPELRSLRGPKVVRNFAAPSAECAAKLRSADVSPTFRPSTAVVPEALGATRAGRMLVVGKDACDETPRLERWAPGSTTSTIAALPLPASRSWEAEPRVITGSGSDEAWILSGQVARVVGDVVSPLPPLPAGEARAAAPAGEGSVYVVAATEGGRSGTSVQRLYRLDAGRAAWEPIELSGLTVDSIVTDAKGTVWISAGTTLLRTRRDAQERSVEIPTGGGAPTDVAKGAARPRRFPKPAGPLCPTNLVVLYGFTKVTPADYDFPLTRKALKGHTELAGTRFVVADDAGQRFFSAIVPDVAMGRTLVSLIEREVQGSKPQLVCAEPSIVRELRIDLRTGEVVP